MKCFWLVIVVAVLWSCKEEEDPGPDLTSGKISFLWNTPSLSQGTNYYAVISDTTGKVLQWSKLGNNTAVEMPYPPGNSKLAHVTIILDIDYSGGIHSTRVQTFTGVAGDSYSYEFRFPPYVNPDGEYSLTLLGRSKFSNATMYVSGDHVLTAASSENDTQQETYGLYHTKTNNLYVQLSKSGEPDYRYLYEPGIRPFQSKTISDQDFDSFTILPVHNITYPENNQMDQTYAFLAGVTNNGTYGIYVSQWSEFDPPVFRYPAIPNLFPLYQSVLYGVDFDGVWYLTEARSPEPVTNFSNLQTSMLQYDLLTTERISANFSGQGDIVRVAGGNFGTLNHSVDWQVYAPKETTVHINLPEFPNDLVTEVPGLTFTKDKPFEVVSIEKINMSYDDFYKFSLKGNLYGPLDFRQTKSYEQDTGNGRRMRDASTILKLLGIKSPHSPK